MAADFSLRSGLQEETMTVHRLKIKVYYEDTDAGGVVYYANYLRYMERARTELLLEKGLDVAAYHERGWLFAVVHVDISYKKPARLGELVEVNTEVMEITHVTITMRQSVLRGDDLLVEAIIKLACINKDGKPQRLPEEFKSF
jgi:acyl-CoA thioester hydrolase